MLLVMLFIFGLPEPSTTVALLSKTVAIHTNKLCSDVIDQETNIHYANSMVSSRATRKPLEQYKTYIYIYMKNYKFHITSLRKL